MNILNMIDIKTAKFLLVGVINTLIGTGVMFFLYNVCEASYWVASASNYIVGSIVSYILNKNFTFKSHDKSLKSILKFILNISACYFVAYGVAKPIVYLLFSEYSVTIKDNVAMLAGMCTFVVLNYLGQRFWVFSENDEN